jgi:hypothetical protein
MREKMDELRLSHTSEMQTMRKDHQKKMKDALNAQELRHKSDNINRDFELIRVRSSLQNRAAKQSNAFGAALAKQEKELRVDLEAQMNEQKKLSEERENGYKEEMKKLKTEMSHQYKLLQVVCKVRTTFCELCQAKLKAGMKKIRKPEL